MFRKSRELTHDGTVTNSTGRPPTPPSGLQRTTAQSSAVKSAHAMASSTTPLVGRANTLPKKTPAMTGKTKRMANGNIMTFFKKRETDGSKSTMDEEDDELFVGSATEELHVMQTMQTPTPPRDSADESPPEAPSPLASYNEDPFPRKRRRVQSPSEIPKPDRGLEQARKGPFVDDSDDDHPPEKVTPSSLNFKSEASDLRCASAGLTEDVSPQQVLEERLQACPPKPDLKRESTSVVVAEDFEGMGDFVDDEFPEEGEEFMERRWMEEQAEMEADMESHDGDIDEPTREGDEKVEDCQNMVQNNTAASACPICGGNTSGLNEDRVSLHVNDCLDGKAAPLPDKPSVLKTSNVDKPVVNGVPGHKRFQRAAIARPGQENPFNLNQASGSSSSAFSKLMSGHAEDNAWATAAAAEVSSRGKPAYQRTCPFYKIMPGLYICVDAFRYGAVADCNAYFLSHFHSDHYIGLTSSWCHGPIYCSHVTANLVRRQLRVDPKWVVDLEFNRKIEVPNTKGVEVTMIPANHCPGSSLFLFEKTLGRGKTQRILHCGDFRACPAHVKHPQLRPDIVDQVSGKLAQQKLDVCYLDTTYLTPKYAFPNQEEVIKACADMCVSLSKDFVDDNDSWEKVKKERAGEGMVKFVRKASFKQEAQDDVKVKVEENMEDEVEQESPSIKKGRGRLLVIVGTYSIGKERICLGVARALNSKIYAPPGKQKVVAALEDPELSARMTDDPLEAQVHMQMLMEIRAETLADYLTGFKPHFSRIVGFRPSGWNYRPPNSRFTESPSVQTVLHSDNWKSRYSMAELVPQRGSTRESNCFGVPYSEHSSFRELTMFCCALRIDKIIPTVNVGSAKSRERMKAWCEKWAMEKKKNGLYRIADEQTCW